MNKYLSKIKDIIDIKSDANRDATVEQINKNIYLRGPNLFYLFCSALIASIGLDISSPAVIIGGMLISPLMSPILGIGLSLGIHDKENFFISGREFLFSVILSLAVSTIYFLLTPLGEPTTEIMARIKPTVLDILIAFFGGVAGIVAMSRTNVSTALPGVAIATALMPPICTAGYGIAKMNSEYFFGAIYLFFINAVFISFSSYLIVRYLNFPFKENPDRKQLIKTRFIISAFVVLIAIPSFFIFRTVISDLKLNQNLEKFIKEISNDNNLKIVEWKYIPMKDGTNFLSIYLAGVQNGSETKDSLNNLLPIYGVKNTKIDLIQLSDENGIEYLKKELKSDILAKTKLIQKSNAELEKESLEKISKTDSAVLSKVFNDIKLFYPEIENIGFSQNYSNSNLKSDSLKINRISTFTIQWKKNVSNYKLKSKQQTLYSYLNSKTDSDTIQIINIK